jgi:hypothetical protein
LPADGYLDERIPKIKIADCRLGGDLRIAVSYDTGSLIALLDKRSFASGMGYFSIRQNLHIMASRSDYFDKRIQKIKQQIAVLGDLRPS